MFYLARTTKKHPRAKKHIIIKGSLEYIKDFVKRSNYASNDKYKVEVYNGKWELVESL